MFYGVRCIAQYEYQIIGALTTDSLFQQECEAVFCDLENAEAYRDWLEDDFEDHEDLI
jgi:hypothetical protein